MATASFMLALLQSSRGITEIKTVTISLRNRSQKLDGSKEAVCSHRSLIQELIRAKTNLQLRNRATSECDVNDEYLFLKSFPHGFHRTVFTDTGLFNGFLFSFFFH